MLSTKRPQHGQQQAPKAPSTASSPSPPANARAPTYLPAKLAKKYPSRISAIRLGRLAISLTRQGKGLGTDLMAMALVKTAETAARVGVAGPFFDAKDDALTKRSGH